jgi:hypothetical protein
MSAPEQNGEAHGITAEARRVYREVLTDTDDPGLAADAAELMDDAAAALEAL